MFTLNNNDKLNTTGVHKLNLGQSKLAKPNLVDRPLENSPKMQERSKEISL